MNQPMPKRPRNRPRGQILVVAVVAMVSMIGGVALILDGGNAYAHQRGVQNGADAVANAGATVVAQMLGGATKTDADVANAVNAIANGNELDSVTAYYTNRAGQLLNPGSAVVTNTSAAARVGDGITAAAQDALMASRLRSSSSISSRRPPMASSSLSAVWRVSSRSARASSSSSSLMRPFAASFR